MPHISPKVEEDRVEKIRAARKVLADKDKETVAVLPQSDLGPDGSVRTRDIAAAIMGVSQLYVQWPLRIQREDPGLFERIWNGQITISAALRVLDGVTETGFARRIRALRHRLNTISHIAAPHCCTRNVGGASVPRPFRAGCPYPGTGY